MALVLEVEGVDLLDYVSAKSLSVKGTAYQQTGTLTFRLEGDPGDLTVSVEDEVVLEDGLTRHFGGVIRGIKRSSGPTPGWVYLDITAQDYTALADDDIIDGDGLYEATLSDGDDVAIDYLFTGWGTKGITIGAEVQEVRPTMPTIDFTGMSLAGAVDEIAKLSAAGWYVDYSKALHYFASEADAAAFGLSDTPNDTTTFGYSNLSIPDESTGLRNAVYFIPGEGLTPTWYEDAGSIATYGRREASLRDERVTVQGTMDDLAAAFLAENANPRRSGTLTTWKAGLRPGMTVQITSADHGLAAEAFRVTDVEMTFPTFEDDPRFVIGFGDKPITLASQLSAMVRRVDSISAVAQGSVASLSDLSSAGANLVLNSSFESGSDGSWTVGSQWAFGYASADPFWGDLTARVQPTGTNTGQLFTTDYIPVDRDDDYWVSAWSLLSAYTAGTAKMLLYEYDAANNILVAGGTPFAAIVAAEADWTRHSIHLGPNDVGRTAFHADTVKVRVAFQAVDSPTLTWEVDGVQVERGRLITAYAPRPQELIDGQVGTTQIADDSVTTEKVVANAIVAGKLAAGAVTAQSLESDLILGSMIRTGPDGVPRVEMDGEGFRAIDSAEDVRILIPTNDDPIFISADVEAIDFTLHGEGSIQNRLSVEQDGVLEAAAGIVAPRGAPTVSSTGGPISVTLEALPVGAVRFGGYYDSAGGASGATACFVTLVKLADGSIWVYEYDLATGLLDRSTELGTSAIHRGFITRIGLHWYIVANTSSASALYDIHLHKMLRSDGSAVSGSGLLNTYFRFASEHGWPIKTDGTSLYIAGPSVSDTDGFRVVKVTTALAHSATVEMTEPALPSGVSYWSPYTWNFEVANATGTTRFWFSMVGVGPTGGVVSKRIYEFNLTTGALTANTDFALRDSNDTGGFYWDGTTFCGVSGVQVREYTALGVGVTNPVWFAYSWYDSAGTTHETVVGPLASIAAADFRRGQIRVTTGALPGAGGADDPNSRRIYGLTSASEPLPGTLRLQGTITATSLSLDAIDTGSALANIGTPFVAGTPGIIQNALDTVGFWEFKGNGDFHLQADGGGADTEWEGDSGYMWFDTSAHLFFGAQFHDVYGDSTGLHIDMASPGDPDFLTVNAGIQSSGEVQSLGAARLYAVATYPNVTAVSIGAADVEPNTGFRVTYPGNGHMVGKMVVLEVWADWSCSFAAITTEFWVTITDTLGGRHTAAKNSVHAAGAQKATFTSATIAIAADAARTFQLKLRRPAGASNMTPYGDPSAGYVNRIGYRVIGYY